MVRFSLSPSSRQGDVLLDGGTPIDESFKAWRNLDELESDSSEEDNSSASSGDDDDDDEEEEPPHPLGFPPSYGRTRFYWRPPRESVHEIRTRLGYLKPGSNDILEDPFVWSERKQSFPPLDSYLDARTAPTASLLSHRHRPHVDDDDDASVDMVSRLLQAASIVEKGGPFLLTMESESLNASNRLMDLAETANRELEAIRRDMSAQQRSMEKEHLEAAEALRMLLQRDQDAADEAVKREKAMRRKLHEAEQARRELEAKEEAERVRATQEHEKETREREQRRQKEEQKRRDAIEAKRIAAAEAEAKKTEYVTKAQKLVTKLQDLRESVEPFEKSKNVAKRRLHMKKIVRGKVNTLNPDPSKIQSVASEVAQEIQQAREEDERNKQQHKAGNAQIAAEMTRGKRYLVDLLASTAMVRTQAEGFNGTRGDGFPLACMLAIVSVDAKELVPVLAAHVYTVCPTAIPQLPRPSKDCSEQELMESLGMLKDKSGEFESFERFLSRTEGIISLVADIMASQPKEHVLLGGHKATVEWLDRFLALLPPPPETLPLLTAPVLDAFLTGAGHMMANIFPEQFKKQLNTIMNDTVRRLDGGPIGEPRALRLKKAVKGGFEYFKTALPSKAIPQLYLGSSDSTGAQFATGAFATNTSAQASNSATPNPFAASSSPPRSSPFANSAEVAASSPFGAKPETTGTSSPSSNNATPNPFVAVAGPSTSSPFASSAAVAAPSPFDTKSAEPETVTIPFGAKNSTGMNASPFGTPGPHHQTAMDQSSSIFTTQTEMNTLQEDSMAVSDQPFASSPSTPFGTTMSQPPAPFGIGNQNASSSPFGPTGDRSHPFASTGLNPAPNPSPFSAGRSSSILSGTGIAAQQSLFGGGSMGASPFGGRNMQAGPSGTSNTQPSLFGTKPSPFGTSNAQSSPFGTSNAQSSPFGTSNTQSSPFGTSNSQPGPFGTSSTQANPFGSGNAQAFPFGGSQMTSSGISSSVSAFGGALSTPFGGSQQTGPFGAGSGTSGTSGKPPCKFFAQGNCRYGANCRFSHDTGGGAGFSSSSFAGGGASRSLGGFGTNVATNPFGPPRR